MNTAELIQLLKREDPSGALPVEIAIRVCSRDYPVAFVAPFDVRGRTFDVRITCSLNEGYTISKPRGTA